MLAVSRMLGNWIIKEIISMGKKMGRDFHAFLFDINASFFHFLVLKVYVFSFAKK